MNNFESIDDYLSNRLSDQDMADFEKRAAADPSLKADLELQRQIINGVQAARKAELKAMLSNVPVGGSTGGAAFAGKIAATILGAGLVGSAIYFAATPSSSTQKQTRDLPAVTAPAEIKQESEIKQPAPAVEKKADDAAPEVKTPAMVQQNKNAATKTPAVKEPKPAPVVSNQPKINVVDPSEDMTGSREEEKSTVNSKKTDNASRIAVDTDDTNRKYNFHYRFSGSKLMLYGPFDKSLYEILEINGDQKSVFLFYKDKYYLLSDKQSSITPLEPISDAGLVKKLKQYRESNR